MSHSPYPPPEHPGSWVPPGQLWGYRPGEPVAGAGWPPPGPPPVGPAVPPARGGRRNPTVVVAAVAAAVLLLAAIGAVIAFGYAFGREAGSSLAAGLPGGGTGAVETSEPVPPPEPGADPGLDSYAQRCHDGDMAACDDLYLLSEPASDHEYYGLTCGGRIKPLDVAVCTDLD